MTCVFVVSSAHLWRFDSPPPPPPPLLWLRRDEARREDDDQEDATELVKTLLLNIIALAQVVLDQKVDLAWSLASF